jgi:CheY-like chemotaxis protein
MHINCDISQWHVMIVDDEPTHNALVRIAFTTRQAQVTIAKDGRQALQILKQMPALPDLLLLDLAMPNMNGAELLLMLEKDGLRPSAMCIVALTALQPDMVTIPADRLHFHGIIHKPLKMNVMMNELMLLVCQPNTRGCFWIE